MSYSTDSRNPMTMMESTPQNSHSIQALSHKIDQRINDVRRDVGKEFNKVVEMFT
ncbi:hypothetical protein HOY82DRAFT_619447 [Tuber indicum]|nr:hypothetical protein HOY82DRAFT_619447 [Tuber indicum]